ncbi:MAG: sodium-translocating pyrophosphatase [Elusimicrobiota bacterium]|jgi:K(+)-stimulated pyrophosphate-energized sodium pump|nr:sodium-translocating pyrophosphatase [Elusimicrobiota bacterium]
MWYGIAGLHIYEQYALFGVVAIAIVGLLYTLFLWNQVKAHPTGDENMMRVWNAIREGANAYLNKQLKTIVPMIVVLTVCLFLSVYIVPVTAEAMERFKGYEPGTIKLIIAFGRAGAFILGSVFSLLVGQIGMRIAVAANVRVTAASKRSFGEALKIAYRSGTCTGMLTDGLGLLGGTLIFIIFGIAAPDALLGFGFGGTLIALFMRVGGGIYTKAADVGADLVGKVENDIPEDDPRNPAVVADLVGDNVGDCAGMAADIFESYEVTIVSGLILGLALWHFTGHYEWIVYPLLVRGIGVFCSIIGTYAVSDNKGRGDAMKAIFRGYLTSAVISIALFAALGYFYLKDVPGGWWRPFAAVSIGVLLAMAIDRITEHFTGTTGAPVLEVKKSTDTGVATTILSGFAVGLESSVWSILIIALSIFSSVLIFGSIDGLNAVEKVNFILYGVAMTGIGMLTLTGNNVAMDSFGPIADNANGVGEMAWHGKTDAETKKARQIMADLDGVGNTTKAITKGVAIGSAVIAAVSLFGSYMVDVSNVQTALNAAWAEQGLDQALTLLKDIGIVVSNPAVFVGMLIGAAVPWLFSSFAINAVRRAASLIVLEVRKQFKTGILEGKAQPNYGNVVSISTIAAQKELITLALLGIVSPVLVGLALGVEALGGFLAGIIVSGQLLAVFMSNAGGAWDNAKKLVEDEPSDPAANTGKGSERHKASVVGDTVGDPLKDTAGPALNPMIKVVNMVAVIVAPIIVTYNNEYTSLSAIGWCVVIALLAILGWVINKSKKPISD